MTEFRNYVRRHHNLLLATTAPVTGPITKGKGGGNTAGKGHGKNQSGGSSDPHYASVGLLAHFNEGAGGTPLDYSSSPKTITLNNGALLVSTLPPAWQGSSLFLDGGNDSASLADNAAWDFGAGDFTVEYYARRATASTECMMGQWSGSSNRGWAIFETNTQLQFFYSTTGSNSLSVVASLVSGEWRHRAVSRVGNTIHLCMDGTILLAAAFTDTINNSTLSLFLGANNGASAFMSGRLGNVRITKGVGRYSGATSSSYTPPTAPYPAS